MFLKNLLQQFFNIFGLFKKDAKILFLGLDNAGKTTLMRRLKDDKMVQHNPTHHAHSEELSYGNINFKAFDLGGHETVRTAWKQYFPKVDGIIYLIDASDPQRFEESFNELSKILEDQMLKSVPIVLLGNKIDKQDAVSQDQIMDEFKIDQLKIDRQIEIFMCSVSKKSGYGEGFKWLSNIINAS